jgi:hypothetical protein
MSLDHGDNLGPVTRLQGDILEPYADAGRRIDYFEAYLSWMSVSLHAGAR